MSTETPEQQLADYQRALEQVTASEREFEARRGLVLAQGAEEFGNESWETLALEVQDALGKDNVDKFMRVIVNTDAPVRIIEALANDPARAKKIAQMPPGRAAAELARIEAALVPIGSGGGADPTYVAQAKGGNRRNLSDETLSDKQFEAGFKSKFYTNGALDGQKFLRR
jgi:hypothetical protein